jgi:hypothetical protein
MMTAVPTNLTAISDVPAEAVIIRRNHRSTSSDSSVTFAGIRIVTAVKRQSLPVPLFCAH